MKGKITKKNTKGKHIKSKQTRNKKNIKTNFSKKTKKGRKNKKGGSFKLIEENKYTKKNTRWKQQKKVYDSLKKSSCDNISNYSELTNRLQTNFVDQPELNIFPNNYTLLPYCNENLKGPSALDKVNAPFTSSLALYSLHSVFKCDFSATAPALINGNYKSVEELSRSKGATSPKNDPEKFFKLIKDIRKNYFIVSHSGFMTKLYDYIVKKHQNYDSDNNGDIYYNLQEEPSIQHELESRYDIITGGMEKNRDYGIFDNLDIIQLIFSMRGELLYMVVRRYTNNYKLENELPLHTDGSFNSVFIMRHCLGCHNVTPGTITKIGQGFKQAITGQNFGYLDWSLCFEDTVDDMNVVGKDLYNLLESYGGFESYTFGSSVIFRAMLTSILMYNVISNIKSKPEQENTSIDRDANIVSRLQEPKDPESSN